MIAISSRPPAKPSAAAMPAIQQPENEELERMFPGHGRAVASILRPFYRWGGALGRRSSDLDERAKRAVFWKDCPGVEVFLPHQESLLRASLTKPFWDGYLAPQDVREQLPILEQRLSLIWILTLQVMEDAFPDLKRPQVMVYHTSLQTAIKYALAHVLAGRYEELDNRHVPILEFWLNGNFAPGYNEQGNALFLVAS